ncbi:hypothetical protein PANI_CDS0033 [Maribacter phage Panino]
MAQVRKIAIPKSLEKLLNISEEEINNKMRKLVSKRKGMSEEERFMETKLADDYIDLFSKNELIAMLIHATSSAGFLEFKLMELMDKGNLSYSLFKDVMEAPLPAAEELSKMYREIEDDNEEKEEDFI